MAMLPVLLEQCLHSADAERKRAEQEIFQMQSRDKAPNFLGVTWDITSKTRISSFSRVLWDVPDFNLLFKCFHVF